MKTFFKIRNLFIAKNLIFLAVLYCPLTTYSQSRKEIKKIRMEHLQQLKEGTLLIRLNTNARKIAILKKQGKQKRAAKIEERTKRREKEIVAAFEDHYDFSNYCFYYEGDSKAIVKDRDFSKTIYNLTTPNCPINASKPVYLLFLEAPSSAFLNQPLVFNFYEIVDNGVVLMENFPARRNRPHRFRTTKIQFLLFGQVDNFSRVVEIIDYSLKYDIKRN